MVTLLGSAGSGELRGCGVAADPESFDFAEPAVGLGFGDAVVEVGDDLFQAMVLGGIDAQHRAADAR